MTWFYAMAADVVQDKSVQRAFWEWLLMLAGGITVVSAAAVIVWKVAIKPHFEDFVRKATEVHKSVTVNGGHNEPPTLRDEMHDLRGQLSQLVTQGGAIAQRTADLGDQVHDLRTLTEDTREDLHRHTEAGEQYLGQVRLVFREQGIELPGTPDDQ